MATNKTVGLLGLLGLASLPFVGAAVFGSTPVGGDGAQSAAATVTASATAEPVVEQTPSPTTTAPMMEKPSCSTVPQIADENAALEVRQDAVNAAVLCYSEKQRYMERVDPAAFSEVVNGNTSYLIAGDFSLSPQEYSSALVLALAPDYHAQCESIVADSNDVGELPSGGDYSEAVAAYNRDQCRKQADLERIKWENEQMSVASTPLRYYPPSMFVNLARANAAQGGSGYTVTCSDGWVSHSGGRQGSCSHHGGNG